MCNHREWKPAEDPPVVISSTGTGGKGGDRPPSAVVDGSRLIPPSRLKWLQLDTSLDLDVNRVCKPSPLSHPLVPSPALSRPTGAKRRADTILKAILPRALPREIGSRSRKAELYEDLAAARVYYCRALINSPLMDNHMIAREGVAISLGWQNVLERNDKDHRRILSR